MKKTLFFLVVFAYLLTNSIESNAQEQKDEGSWTIRYNQPATQDLFTVSNSQDGFTCTSSKIDSATNNSYVFYLFKLEEPITRLTFNYQLTGDAALMPIKLFDAAANELWQFDGQGVDEADKPELGRPVDRVALVLLVHAVPTVEGEPGIAPGHWYQSTQNQQDPTWNRWRLLRRGLPASCRWEPLWF